MNVARMNHAVAVLRRVVEEERPYDHNNWVEDEDDPFNCSTAACSAGWLIRDPYLNALGLKLHDEGAYPTYNGLSDYHALGAFFAITETQAKALFGFYYACDDDLITPDMVADQMQRMLEDEVKALEAA
jgi:hypothetical protein